MNLSDVLLQNNGIEMINDEVQKNVFKNYTLYVYEDTSITCENGYIQDFRMHVYYNFEYTSYVYSIVYANQKLQVTSQNDYDNKVLDKGVSWEEYTQGLKSIRIIQGQCKIDLIDSDLEKENTEFYILSNNHYLVASEINKEPDTSKKSSQSDSLGDVAREGIVDSEPDTSKKSSQSDSVGDVAGNGIVDSESILNDGVGYRLREVDAALGSRLYALDKTSDHGKNWVLWNKDPFATQLGSMTEIGFMNEKIGFIKLTRSQGGYSQLFSTHDGGKTFREIHVKGNGDYDYFVLPYIEGQKYCLKVFLQMELTETSDYILYTSSDKGKTWVKQK